MPQIGRRVKNALGLATAAILLAACGPRADIEAEKTAAAVRLAVVSAAQNAQWAKGRCLCAGLFRGETVEDFPAGMLAKEAAAHPWLRPWTECAANYHKKNGLAACKAGMTDYVCSTVEKDGLPAGTTRVICHVNGKNELLSDEYDVAETAGGYKASPISVKALYKTYE